MDLKALVVQPGHRAPRERSETRETRDLKAPLDHKVTQDLKG